MKKLTHFENGMTLVYYGMPEIRSISIGVFVKVGSVYENNKNNGISHFIEHTMFKGTERRSAFDIVAECDNIGANINAFTSKTTTCYYCQCVDQDVDKCADILSDIYFNSTFPTEEIEKEKGVVLSEIAMSNDTPDDLVFEITVPAFYKGHPLSRPILGSKANVKNFTKYDIADYIDRHYTADNTYLSIAGNLSYEQAVEIAEKYFIGKFRRLKCSERKIDVADSHSVYVKKIKNIEQGNIVIAFPTYEYTHPLTYATRIFNSAFGYGMSSRLYQQIRENMGLAYSVYSYPSCLIHNGMIYVYLGTDCKDVEKAVRAVRGEIDKVKKDYITNEEFVRGKAQIKSSLIYSVEGSSSVMTNMGRHVLQTGDLLDMDKMIADIDAVTMDDVKTSIDENFDISLATVGYVGPKIDKNLLDILQNN